MKEKFMIFLMVMVCMLIPCRTKAQETPGASGDLSMYSVGKQWHFKYVDIDYSNHNAVTERDIYRTIIRDTTINDVHCYLELASTVKVDMNNLHIYKYADEDLRKFAEIDGWVCEYMDYLDQFIPQMCFDVVPGQGLPTWSLLGERSDPAPDDVFVIDVMSFETRGVRRKVIQVPQSIDNSRPGLWIEGIGNINGLSLFDQLYNGSIDTYIYLLECTQDGEVLFDEEDMARLTAQVGIPEIPAGSRPGSDASPLYYNLHGERVDSPVKGDILIRVRGDRRDKVVF